MMSPMAMARPPSDIRLSVPLKIFRKKNVPMTESGREVAATRVVLPSRRKPNRINMASAAPMMMASRTLPIESETNSARL